MAYLSGGAVLVVTRGPNSGSRFVLAPEAGAVVTIGRHPESDVFLDDITVSRRHAEVPAQRRAFSAHDVGSLNGTYLNRERIEPLRCRAGTSSRWASSASFSSLKPKAPVPATAAGKA